VIPVVAALAVALQGVWLPAHLAFDPHLGDGHVHERSHARGLASVRPAGHGHRRARGHGHAHGHGHDHAHGHDHPADHGETTPPDEGHELPAAAEDHDPHEPHHPITDHQPPVVANPGASAPGLASIEPLLRLPERLLLARVRARAPPPWPGDPPPPSFRSRAPPSA